MSDPPLILFETTSSNKRRGICRASFGQIHLMGDYMNHLADKFGRVVTKLRVSVTDKCNMRCLYCMPAEGLEWTPREEILTFEEITRVVKLSAELGVRKIRVTGGEPLLRKGVENLVYTLSQVSGIQTVSMT